MPVEANMFYAHYQAREDSYLVEVKLSCEMSCYTFNDSSHFHHNIVVPKMHHIGLC